MALTEESVTSTTATSTPETSEAANAAPVEKDKKQLISRLGALFLAVGITGAILLFAPYIRQFSITTP